MSTPENWNSFYTFVLISHIQISWYFCILCFWEITVKSYCNQIATEIPRPAGFCGQIPEFEKRKLELVAGFWPDIFSHLIVEFEKVVVDVHVVPFEPSYHLKLKFSVQVNSIYYKRKLSSWWDTSPCWEWVVCPSRRRQCPGPSCSLWPPPPLQITKAAPLVRS